MACPWPPSAAWADAAIIASPNVTSDVFLEQPPEPTDGVAGAASGALHRGECDEGERLVERDDADLADGDLGEHERDGLEGVSGARRRMPVVSAAESAERVVVIRRRENPRGS